jgi:RNA-directed DNA polymerase
MSLEPDGVERLRKKLYEKAKQEPDFRFYSLYDKVCWAETLERSYRQAKANAGAAGVDGVRFEDIESYGVDRWLAELRQELVEETYRPQPVRRVMIPKPDGGERPLGIPTIRDRVVQTAVVLFLGPIFEADFEDNVYAYRPERSAHDALAEVRERLYGGQEHVVDADVTKYFDTIPHAELLQSVARRIADGKILRLLKLWLKSPVEEVDERGNRRMTGGKKSKRGTPQGGVVSPLLANIYINRLLRHWRKTGALERLGQIISYADDFVIVCASRRQAEESLSLVSRWLEKLGLTIHPTKTRLCHAREESFDFLGYTFGPARHWKTGKRFISVYPSKKAQKRLKEKINTLLHRGNPTKDPLPAAQAARQRNKSLRIRRGLWGKGSGRSPPDAPATKACACLLVKPVREPDAGDPQVRFDERRWETEPRPRLRHRHQRRKPPVTATPSTYSHRARRRLYLLGYS